MPLQLPTLGEANYKAIFEESLARIPVHNPEWTNFNEGDPGVTLLQLYSFLSENLLYRANLIPDRNRLKFLKLLGVSVREASSATGFVTFENLRAPLKTRLVRSNIEVLAGQTPFRLQSGLEVVPVESKVYFKRKSTAVEDAATKDLYDQLYASYSSASARLTYYETTEQGMATDTQTPTVNISDDTVDNKLWVALLAPSANGVSAVREELANRHLSLGVIPVRDPAAQTIPEDRGQFSQSPVGLTFHIPDVRRDSQGRQVAEAQYQRLFDNPLDGANPLLDPAIIELRFPAADRIEVWNELDPLEPGTGDFPPFVEDEELNSRIVTWIRIGIPEIDKVGPNGGRIHVVGVNASLVTQRARVSGEFVGLGSGEPDQSFALTNTPIIAGSVELTVNGERWYQIDDIANAVAEVPKQNLSSDLPTSRPEDESTSTEKLNVFTVDRESGQLRFGDGLRGRRPMKQAVIQASYDYGGGVKGLVGVGAISKATSLPAGIKARNPIRTWGGSEAESLEEAEKRIPAFLRHRDRLVSKDDFQDITYRAPGVSIGRVETLSLYDAENSNPEAPGHVTVLTIPKYDLESPETPEPDQVFLKSVCEYLHPRRLITTRLHIRGPEYVPIWVSIGIETVEGQSFATAREDVKAILRQFLSALTGGFEGSGWPLSKTVDAAELLAVAARIQGVSKVNEALLCGASGEAVQRIDMSGLKLPRLKAVEAQSGAALPVESLRGDPSSDSSSEGTLIPAPVIPDSC